MQLVEQSMNPLSSNGGKILSGPFADMDVFNQNGRRYPEDIYDRAYEELIPKIQEKRLLGELDHPLEYDEVRLSNVSHAITECHAVEEDGIKRYYGTVELLDTPAGMIAQALVKAGINLGISSRGLGSTRQVRDGVEVTQLKLITFDLVADPSFANAVLTPEKSDELSDSLHYIESKLPLNESVETNSIREKIHQIRESLISKKTNLDDRVNINKVEVDSLKELLESANKTIKSDTLSMTESRKEIKNLRSELKDSKKAYNSLLENMNTLQDEYNKLVESLDSRDSKISSLEDQVLDLQKSLAVEKRGMSYNKVSELLEGANNESEIESRLNSLSSLRKERKTQFITENRQTVTTPDKKLKGLASIISRV